PVLQGAAAPVRIDCLLIDADSKQAEHVGAGSGWEEGERGGGPAGVDPNFSRARLRQRGGHMDSRRHAVGGFPQAPDAVAVRGIQARPPTGEGTDTFQNRLDARTLQRQLGEPFVYVVRQLYLRE